MNCTMMHRSMNIKKILYLHDRDQLLIMFSKIITVYCKNHTQHTYTLCGQNVDLMLKQVI